MKKFVVLSLVGLLIMAFSATAYAQIDFKAYGALFAGFVAHRNLTGGSDNITSYFPAPYYPSAGAKHGQPPGPDYQYDYQGAWDKTATFYSSYANIFLEWNAGKEVKGVFNIETCNYYSGRNTIDRTATLPTGLPLTQVAQGAEFDTGLWNTRLGQTRLRLAYIQFGVPYIGIPVPMTVTAGVIPMAVRPAFMFALTNGAGIQVDVKPDPLAFSFTWGKMAEGKIQVADDSNHYSLEARANLGPATVGGYILHQDMNTYPIAYNPTAYGAPSSNYEANMWWLGAYADAKAGPVNLNLDFALDTGKVKGDAVNSDGVNFYDDKKVKYRGWAGQVKATFPWDKFSFGGVLFYATGADLKKTSRGGNPGDSPANDLGYATSRVGSFVFPAGSNQWVVWAESMFLGGNFSTLVCIPQGMQAANWGNRLSRGATGGTWVAKLSASAQATPWYRVTLWGLYIGDTTKNGNTLGDAVKANGQLRDDKTIGWELALVQDINIYKNLTLTIGSGILFAKDALDQQVTSTAGYLNKSPKNPFIFSTKLAYMF